jgi:hypothetical protein
MPPSVHVTWLLVNQEIISRLEMIQAIEVGTIMMLPGTPVPESLHISSEPYRRGWNMVLKADTVLLDTSTRKAGWGFFFLAANTRTLVWGYWGERTGRKAMQRLLSKVKSLNFNSLEITEIISRKFLGIPYVRVSAHSRHMQKGLVLQALEERSRAARDAAWAAA